MSNELTSQDVSNKGIFSNVDKFQQVQFMAESLAQSDLIPKDYQRKPANVLIALSMAERMKADPMMVMQNLYVIHGRPSWSSQFLIACVNSCGKFSALQYEFFGTPNTDEWGCSAYATELESNQIVKGPSITMAMAKAEGWYGKNGSKWKTLPELMLTYRAAAFFVRTKAPEISMGMHTEEEARDMGQAVVVENNTQPMTDLKALQAKQTPKSTENILDNLAPAPEQIIDQQAQTNDIDIVKFMKMSIDSCTTIEDLEECGDDIKNKKDDGEFDVNQLSQVKAHYSAALKAIKNQ